MGARAFSHSGFGCGRSPAGEICTSSVDAAMLVNSTSRSPSGSVCGNLLTFVAIVLGKDAVSVGDSAHFIANALDVASRHGHVKLVFAEVGVNAVADAGGADDDAALYRSRDRHTRRTTHHRGLCLNT